MPCIYSYVQAIIHVPKKATLTIVPMKTWNSPSLWATREWGGEFAGELSNTRYSMPYELMYSGGSWEIYFQNILHNIVAKTFDAVCVVPNVLESRQFLDC